LQTVVGHSITFLPLHWPSNNDCSSQHSCRRFQNHMGMKKALVPLFLALFIGRMVMCYLLEQPGMNNLKAHGKAIPPAIAGEINEATPSKMVDYAYDTSGFATKENLLEDTIDPAMVFLSGFMMPLCWKRNMGFPRSPGKSGFRISSHVPYCFCNSHGDYNRCSPDPVLPCLFGCEFSCAMQCFPYSAYLCVRRFVSDFSLP